jgi:hypothetical protein
MSSGVIELPYEDNDSDVYSDEHRITAPCPIAMTSLVSTVIAYSE